MLSSQSRFTSTKHFTRDVITQQVRALARMHQCLIEYHGISNIARVTKQASSRQSPKLQDKKSELICSRDARQHQF